MFKDWIQIWLDVLFDTLMVFLKEYMSRDICGIFLTSVDSDKPVQSLLSLETPNDVQSVV